MPSYNTRWRRLLIVGKPLKSVSRCKLSQLEKNAVIQHPGGVAPVDCRKTLKSVVDAKKLSQLEKCRHTTPRWRQLLIVGKPLKSVVDTKKLSQLEKKCRSLQHPGGVSG
ncbi:hypothetical protein J6590_070889 [Homalodisca vitripennis]|nr:hypothetical protein J6590_070889 [Homalodisca vitripennis]